MRWLSIGGCLATLGLLALVAATMHAMGLAKPAIVFGQVLFGLVSSPDALPENWTDAEAEILTITIRSDANRRDEATIVMRYPDSEGRERIGTFEVYSPSRGLAGIKQGNNLGLKVCRRDATVVKSEEFLLSEPKKCAEAIR